MSSTWSEYPSTSEGKGLDRASTDYLPMYQRFLMKKKAYGQQYSHVYTKRLEQLKPAMIERGRIVWDDFDQHYVSRVVDVDRSGKECILIGTTYKEMKLKPNILDEFSKERQIEPPPLRDSYISQGDYLILEDDAGRVDLVVSPDLLSTFMTGVVCAVRGRVGEDGRFLVEDIAIPGPSTKPPSLPQPQAESKGKCVLLLSGLGMGLSDDGVDAMMARSLLLDYVEGCASKDKELTGVSSIARIVICGGVVGSASKVVDPRVLADMRVNAKDQDNGAKHLREADEFLGQLASIVPVDIMPSMADPANHNMPQQPLHPCLFPTAASYASFRAVTNPYECRIGDKVFLGTSGQVIGNLLQYTVPQVVIRDSLKSTASRYTEEPSTGADTMDASWKSLNMRALENCFYWRHIAPNAPDTLPCYPFYDSDPFVMETCPNVLFAGNQPEYAAKTAEGSFGKCRIVCVPEFHKTATAVLLNLETLETTPLGFGGPPVVAKDVIKVPQAAVSEAGDGGDAALEISEETPEMDMAEDMDMDMDME